MAVKEGEIALVYTSETKGLSEVSEFTSIMFPSEITVSSFTSSGSAYIEVANLDDFYAAETHDEYRGDIRITSTQLQISFTEMRRDGTYKSSRLIYKKSSLSKKFTISTQSGFQTDTFIKLAFPMKIEGSNTYINELISQCMTGNEEFGGIYKCQKNTWKPLNIGVTVEPNNVLSGVSYYDSEGFKEGTLGNPKTRDEFNGFYAGLVKSMHESFKPTDMTQFFAYKQSTLTDTYLPMVGVINTSECSNFNSCFAHSTAVKSLDLSNWITSNATDMFCLLESCSALENVIGLNCWDVSKVTRFSRLARYCSKLKQLDLSTWVNEIATDFSLMFQWDGKLTSLDLRGIKPMSGADVSQMFWGCVSLQFLDVRQFEFTDLTNTDKIFGTNTSSNQQGMLPADCLIIVKDDTQRNWIKNNHSWLINIKTVAEYEAA